MNYSFQIRNSNYMNYLFWPLTQCSDFVRGLLCVHSGLSVHCSALGYVFIPNRYMMIHYNPRVKQSKFDSYQCYFPYVVGFRHCLEYKPHSFLFSESHMYPVVGRRMFWTILSFRMWRVRVRKKLKTPLISVLFFPPSDVNGRWRQMV